MRSVVFASLLVAGCSGDSLIQVVPTWPQDQVAIAVITAPDGTPLGPSPLLLQEPTTRFTIEVDESMRVHLLTFPTKTNGGPDFASCGLGIRSTGNALPPPARYFVSESIERGTSSAIALTEAPQADALALGLTHIATSCMPRYPCDEVGVKIFDAPIRGVQAHTVTALDDHRALIGLRGPEGDAARVLELRSELARILVEEASFGPLYALVFDGRGSWATTDDGFLFRFSPLGVITSSVVKSGIARPIALTSDRGGNVIAHGDIGVEVLGGTISEAKRTAIASLGFEPLMLEMASPDRIVAEANNSFHYFDGENWSVERENAPKIFEEFFALHVEAGVAVAAGKFEQVIVRDESARMWRSIPPINTGQGLAIRSITSLGGDRYLAVGEVGLAAIYQNGGWCTIDTRTTNGLNAVAIAPSRRTAYVAGSFSVATDNKPVLLRFDLPE